MKKQFIPLFFLFSLLLTACGGNSSEAPAAGDAHDHSTKEATHDHGADTSHHDHDHGHDHQHDHDAEHAH